VDVAEAALQTAVAVVEVVVVASSRFRSILVVEDLPVAAEETLEAAETFAEAEAVEIFAEAEVVEIFVVTEVVVEEEEDVAVSIVHQLYLPSLTITAPLL
jgi:hypothetical protein